MITAEQEITIIKSWAESCKTEVQLEHVNNFLNTKFVKCKCKRSRLHPIHAKKR